jgi:hypothetical protein
MKPSISLSAMRELFPKNANVLSSWFVFCAGGILLLDGISKFFGFWENFTDIPDPVFGLSFRSLMLFVGMIEIAMAGLCLFTTKRTLNLTLMVWVMLNFTAYRVGLWVLGWHHPYALDAGLVNSFDISPSFADRIGGVVLVYLYIGSILSLWFKHRMMQAVHFSEVFCPDCGGKIKCPTGNLGKNIGCPHCQAVITLREPGNLKMTCVLCKGNIEFPSYSVGQKISCPHCTKTITLLNPT